jgi:hypothetical protein
VKGLNEELTNTEARLAAEGGITQKIKDQIAAREALKNSPGTKITEKVAQMKTELADTGGMIISLADTIEGELGSAMSNAISGIISGTTTAEEAFSQMFKNIGAAFIDMATKMIAKALIMKVLGILGSGMGGASSGGLDKLNTTDFMKYSSFDGGGFTGDGARSGGVDGKGGFPAILHPQETVIDHTDPAQAMGRYRPGSGSSGQSQTMDASGGDAGGGGGGGTFTLETVMINSVEYATVSQVREMSAMAAKQGAEGGHQRVMGDFRNKRSVRSRMGMR